MTSGQRTPAVVALGTFDGMHMGHRQVIREAVRIARARNVRAVVYTFENHPRSVFGQAPVMLMTAGEREAAMRLLGVDEVHMVRFDRRMAALTPRQFLEALLERCDVRAVVAGSDYTFGHQGAGTIETLKQEGRLLGFDVYEIPFVMLGGEKVSSTRIRDALARGDTALARELLGAGEERGYGLRRPET